MFTIKEQINTENPFTKINQSVSQHRLMFTYIP